MLKWYKIYSNEGSVLQKLRTTVARNRTGVGGSAGAAGSAPAAAGEQGKLPGAESREAAHSRRCRRGEVLIANAVRIAAMYCPAAERLACTFLCPRTDGRPCQHSLATGAAVRVEWERPGMVGEPGVAGKKATGLYIASAGRSFGLAGTHTPLGVLYTPL